MTHASHRAAALSAASCLAFALAGAADAQAQCATCPTPTIAFSPVVTTPVVAAPVVAAPAAVVVQPRLGFFDRWRLRRWGVAVPPTTVATVATVATPALVQTQSVAFAPAVATTHTVGFAPAPVTAFSPVVATPHLTSFAPLQRSVQVVSYAPTTAIQSAVLSPVQTAPACTTCSYGCTTCTVASPCDSCSSCATTAPATGYVDQAAYASVPSSGCSDCAATSGTPVFSGAPAGGVSGSSSDPITPIPQIADPATSGYPPADPGPEADGTGATGASFEAPLLFNPNGDPTASRPTVDIHTAVYRRPATVARTSTTAARPVAATPTRKAVDSSGWKTVD